MKSVYVILTASLFFAAIPLAGASHNCYDHPPSEGIAHPLSPGRYLFVSATDTAKIGEWMDSNTRSGLQTSACRTATFLVYKADTKADILP
jgi:hypothetical protein